MLNLQAEFFRKLFESLDNSAVLMRVGDDGVYYPIWYSRGFLKMMEGTEEDFIRLGDGIALGTLHPDDRAAVAYMFRHHAAEDGSNTLTIRRRTMKGRELWLSAHYAFVDYGGDCYAYCTYVDVTDTKKREELAETARQERESLRVLHDMLNSGPWYMDFDEQGNMTRVTWSDTFRRMIGYQSEEDFPNELASWSDLLREEDRERILNEYYGAVNDYTGQKAYNVEYELLTKDRGWRWFHAIGQPTRRADGSPITYVGLFVDITERKEMQRKLSERQVSLKNALEEANQANVAKTAFLSSMSHELRTPMNAIIGLGNIALRDSGLPERTREYLEKISSSANHLLSLINDILDVSRIESGHMALRNEKFSFRAMLEQINNMIGGQCQERGLSYDCTIHGQVDEYYIGDDTKLKQVFLNILGNAVKFTPRNGTVTFSVERVTQYEEQSVLRFVIRDTGIGMDPEYLPRIFDAFSQENSANTTAYGGTGLGMVITKSIVEMMNGAISVESEKGAGSTFTVELTLKNCDQGTQYAGDFDPREVSVLVIDDDPVALEHARLVLGEVGITAETCQSGAEALQRIEIRRARQESFDLILVDLRMPGQNGVEVARRIREFYDAGDTAIIMLTAYSWDDVLDETREAGVDSFMSKPLFASSVLDELRRAIRNKSNSKPHSGEIMDLSGKHILLAEDILINAEIMQEILGMRDMTVDHAENGRIAVEMFAESPTGRYDAVLMDIRMPEMDGLEATRSIRALDHPDAKSVPIIALTANAFDEDVQRSLQAGMNAHLSKPVETEHLYETLAKLI